MTVRAFGALRELVGDRIEVEATDVRGLLDDLAAVHGPEFRRRMERASVVVGDLPRAADDARPLEEGDEVVLLPPFAGG